MNGWSSQLGDGAWDDEPAWVYEITWEWEPLPGQRYPGDPGRRKAVHTPVYEASGQEQNEPGYAPRAVPPQRDEAGRNRPAAPDQRRGFPAPPDGPYRPGPSQFRPPPQ